jgi:ABC-2 type transport system permease protein
MLRKIWNIIWVNLYITFTDRNLLLIMIATPLALATIIALAFSGLMGGSGDAPVKDIPIAIVNLDKGANGQNFGQIYVNAFLPDAGTANGTTSAACPTASTASGSSKNTLTDLTDATGLDDAAAARADVDSGKYTAAIIIPEDFSQKLSYGPGKEMQATAVEVYANGGRTLTAGIIRSIVESITNQIATGNIVVAATLQSIAEKFGLLQVGAVANQPSFAQNVACAFTPGLNSIQIEQQTVTGQPQPQPNFLVLIGSAQAMFFMLFTAQGSASSLVEERRSWTLQRLIISPTPRFIILLGKLLSTFVQCVVQITILVIAFTVVGSLMAGKPTLIWGSNIAGLALVVLSASLAVAGIGILLLALIRKPEQANMYGSMLNMGLGILGGAFGFSLPAAIAQISPLYWGTDAFGKLSAGQGDITINVLVLLVEGVVMFLVGMWLFNRRADI